MERMVSVGEAARKIREPPRRVSDGFYKRWFDSSRCRLVSRRWLIPVSYLPEMASILRSRANGSRGRDCHPSAEERNVNCKEQQTQHSRTQ